MKPSAVRIPEPIASALPALRDAFYRDGWWTGQTFGELAEQWSKTIASATAFRDDHTSITWEYLTRLSRRLATTLAARGLAPGSRVALQLSNQVEYAVAHLACELLGAPWTNLTPNLRRRDLVEILGTVGSAAIVVPETFRGFDYLAMIDEVRREVPSLTTVIPVRPGAAGETGFAELVPEPPGGSVFPDRLGADDVYSLMLSAGTTSPRPKQSIRSMNSMLAVCRSITSSLRLTEQDRIFCMAPLTQGVGYVFGVALAFLTGASCDVSDHPVGHELLDRIDQSDPTVLVGVPTQTIRLLEETGSASRRWARLRAVLNAGAPLPPDVAGRAEDRLGCPILSAYGASDGMMPVLTQLDDRREVRHTRVGRAAPGHQLKIIDAAAQELGAGQEGEICGWGPSMAFGYLDNDGEMAAAWDADAWWHSGDLGVIDDAGYLRVVGRKKDMILRGGTNISPLEIETLLHRHPQVLEAAVVRMPHPDLGEQACAYVVPVAGGTLDFAEMVDFLLAAGIAKYKLPERLELRAALPRSGAEKLDKARLEREITEIVAEERKREGAR